MAYIFSEEIIYIILSRLPIKSLACFRCVCKLWLKYINDSYFLTIYIQEETTPIMFELFPHIDPNKIKFTFLCGGQKDPILDWCFKRGSFYDNLLIGLCNGLTLVSYEKDHSHAGAYRFALINPFSKQRHDLPPISLKVKIGSIDLDGPREAAGIGFDDSINTLKTVFSFHANTSLKVSRTMVHSSGTSSWRKIPHAYPTRGEGVFGHGRLYWLASDYVEYDSIVWFDLKTDEFGSIYPPLKPKNIYDIQLADLNGEVGFVDFGPMRIKLWILKPEEEWVLHCCIDVNLIVHEPSHYTYLRVSGCWNKDGDILFTYKRWERLLVYTLKTGDLQQVLELSNEGYAGFRMYRSNLFLLNTSAYSVRKKSQKNERVKCYSITHKSQNKSERVN